MTEAKQNDYDKVRQAFFEFMRQRILYSTGVSVEVKAVEYNLLEQVMDWKNRRYSWDWFDIKRKFRNIPARFELALTVNGEVCGLIIGKPSRGKRHVSAYYLEGNPSSSHPLKGRVLTILLDGLALYAELLGCTHIRLIDPVKGLLPLYQRAGLFLIAEKNSYPYCEKSVKRSYL